MIYLDVIKAFDKVSHPDLLLKLYQLKIPFLIIKHLKSYLENGTFQVKLLLLCTLKPIQFGVPQGSAFGSILFNIYTNGIPLLPRKIDVTAILLHRSQAASYSWRIPILYLESLPKIGSSSKALKTFFSKGNSKPVLHKSVVYLNRCKTRLPLKLQQNQTKNSWKHQTILPLSKIWTPWLTNQNPHVQIFLKTTYYIRQTNAQQKVR